MLLALVCWDQQSNNGIKSLMKEYFFYNIYVTNDLNSAPKISESVPQCSHFGQVSWVGAFNKSTYGICNNFNHCNMCPSFLHLVLKPLHICAHARLMLSHTGYTWISIYTLSAETASHLHMWVALLCYHAPACLQAPVSAESYKYWLGAVSDLILPKIQPTILLAQQPKEL